MNSFKEKLSLVHNLPGCYIMKNKDGFIIYIGKAKDLKRRLSSYFNKVQTGKTRALVENIFDFEYIITKTETESLILEINLIKKYNPKYNILLKDDKTYPFIELTNEKYPRIKIVRTKKRKINKNKLFGPYPNVVSARQTVLLINRLFPLRKCNTFPKEVCLYYHLGECLGYCKYEVLKSKIDEMIKEITSILNGDYKKIVNKLEQEMLKASENLQYEKANEIKNLIYNVKETINKQIIVSNVKYNFDVFGFYEKDNYLACDCLFVREGIVIGHKEDIVNINDYEKDFYERYIAYFYEKYELPKSIVINSFINEGLLKDYFDINVIVPKKGDIKKILNMANINAENILNEKLELLKRDNNAKELVEKSLKQMLNLDSVSRIELFDNSHLFGTYYVGAMVVYKDFSPLKKEYRKYKINAKVKDDLSAMKEVTYRRFYKMLLEKTERPDLVIIDGGQLQVKAAKEVLTSLNLDIKVIGLKKNEHHKTKSIIDDNLVEIPFQKDNNLLLYLTRMQDEVHRFVISYHRDLKNKSNTTSILDEVEGIGPKRKKELLKHFGSINKIKEAKEEELRNFLPQEVISKLKEYLNNA